MKINDWKGLFLFSPLTTNELVKFRSFPPHMDIFSFSSFSLFAILPFFQLRGSKTYRGVEGGKKKKKKKQHKENSTNLKMLFYFILRQKGTKEKVVVKKDP